LVVLMSMVWIGGRLDSNALADKYLAIGTQEIEGWEDRLFQKLTSKSTNERQEVSEPTSDEIIDAELEPKQRESVALSSYGEMVYRRLELLRPNPQSQFVIGTNLLMRGAVTQAQKILKKIAPDDKKGDPKAHSILAISYLNQLANTQDPQLLSLLLHHADSAAEWSNTPKDVMLLAVDLNWQNRNIDRSLELLASAAERFPDLYPALFQRSLLAGKNELAETARQKAIVHYESELEADPKNDEVRVQLVQLLSANNSSLDAIEQLLRAGIELESTPKLTQALSEVYRIRFVKAFIESEGRLDDFSLLESALEIEPTNAQVIEQIARLIRDGRKPSVKLQQALDSMLASDQVTVGTHAILSEFHLAENRPVEAIAQLEKVFQSVPSEVKYANNLAYLYAQQDRLEDAQRVARTCLEVLQQSNQQNQPFVDELLDTLGMIYQKQEKISDAISSYELALRFNPDRIDSRERLAAIYRQIGNEGVAAAHEQAIETIKAALLEQQNQERETKPD
jgi:tetratricopeptide (TPR) repeat protein